MLSSFNNIYIKDNITESVSKVNVGGDHSKGDKTSKQPKEQRVKNL